MRKLNLEDLADGVLGVSTVLTACYLEAAKVAFAKQNISSGVILQVSGSFKENFLLVWQQNLTTATIDSWKNNHDIAELGAIAIAILLIKKLTNYQYFEIGEIGTHVDFWLGLENNPSSPLFAKRDGKIEISGIFSTTKNNTISKRIAVKRKQIAKSNIKSIPSFVSVTAFNIHQSKFIKNES